MRPARLLPSLASIFALTHAVPAVSQPAGEGVPALPVASVPAEASGAAVPARKPQLILAISVDQFSSDLFAQYRQHFTGGLARLTTGAVFPQGFQSHAATETCPGHSTILTGAHPARTGIIANNWYDAKAGRVVYCSEDERDPESTVRAPVVSSWHLKVPTLGELMKKADPAARNVAVAGKDRAAVMMSGHDADAAYWWLGNGFATYKGRALSPAVAAQNAATRQQIEAGAPAFHAPQWCEKLARAVPVKTFTIGTERFPLKAGDFKSFGRTPRLDAATGELAVRLVDEMNLGKDEKTDVLSVSFSATDYVGHAYGHQGVEMCIQLAQLDASLGKLLDALDTRGIDYLAVLTADHGGIDAPERLQVQGYPAAQRIDPALGADALSSVVSEETGITAASGQLFHGGGSSGDIWLAPGLSTKQQKRVVQALLKQLAAHPQVEAAYSAEMFAKMPLPAGNPQDWTMVQRVRASFDPERSGQVLMMTKRGVVPGDPQPGYTATHGSPWDYDRRVPILFWRKGMTGFEQPNPVKTVDIAPTLAAAIGLDQKEGAWDGQCLDIDGSEADTCRR